MRTESETDISPKIQNSNQASVVSSGDLKSTISTGMLCGLVCSVPMYVKVWGLILGFSKVPLSHSEIFLFLFYNFIDMYFQMIIYSSIKKWFCTMPQRIYNTITAIGFLAMFTFQLNNTKR